MKPTSEQIEHVRKGIAAYGTEQKVILRLLRRFKSFTERDFDRWFRGREFRPRRLRRNGIAGDSFLLGIGVNGFTEWATTLELLQYMMVLGLVDAKTVNGIVIYELPR